MSGSLQLRNWIGESRTRCSSTDIVLKASEEALRDSSVLLAMAVAAIERAAFRRRARAGGQLLDPLGRTLQIVAQRGFGPEFLDFFREVHGAGAACGAAMRSGRQVIVEDVATHPIFVGQRSQDVLLRAGVRAVQSTPLITPSGELVGMISTHFRSRHRLPAYRLRLIDIISRQAAELIRDVHDRHQVIGTT